MGSLTRGLSDDIMSLNAEPILGVADEELLSVTLSRIAKHVDSPLRLFASATPDALLNISSNVVEVGDGAAKTTPPLDGSIGSFPATTINMQTGVVTGGTVKLASEEAFTLPAGTLNYFRRMCLSLSGNTVYVAFSPEAATVGALEDPGITFANLLGLPAGYLTIQVTNITGKYKTANSTTDVIENKVGSTPVIMRFGAGGGGGGAGGDESFKVRTVVADGTTTIKGGSIALSDGRVISTYSGSGSTESSFNQNITFDLDTLQPAAVNNTTYYLYVDLDSLTPTTLSDTGRTVYGVTSSKIILSTVSPESIDRVRYAAIGSVRRATGTWSTTGITYPPKRAISDAPGDNSFKPMSASTVTTTGGSLQDTTIAGGSTLNPGFDITARFGVKTNATYVSGKLTTVQFYIRQGSATGNVFAELWNVSGGTPTTVAATSNLVPASTLPVGSSGWVTFTFPTTPDIVMGNDYVFALGRDTVGNLVYHTTPDYATTTYMIYSFGSWSQFPTLGFPFNATIVGTSTSTLVVNRGSLLLADSREIYSAADISVPITGYSSDGNYYIYIDLLTLPAPTVVNGRTVTLVTASSFVLMTNVPSTINRSRYMPVGFIIKATTWQAPTPISSRSYSFGIDSSNYQEYTLPSQAIGAVGSSGQIAAGHDLVSGSFPSAALASTSYYNLAGLLDANTSLAHNLSNVGTALFTGTGILGAANSCVALNGSNQYLNSTDINFDPGDVDFTFGGWLKPSSLTQAMPLCSQCIGGSMSFRLEIYNFGTEVILGGSIDGLNEQLAVFPMTFTAGAWYHLAAKYVASTNTFHVYVNAIKIGTHTLTGNLRAAGASRNFQLGGDTTGGKYFPGNIDEFFFCNGTAFTDEAINKIFAYKLSHNKYVVPSGQDWLIHAAYNGTTKEISNSIIVTKDYNDLYIDLSGYDPTTVVTAAMETKGAFGTAVPSNARMLEGTAAEIDALINGVGLNFFFSSMITAVELWAESDTANLFERHPNVSGYFLSESVPPYRLMFNVDTLTSVLGGTKRVKVIVSTGGQAIVAIANDQIKVTTVSGAYNIVDKDSLVRGTGAASYTVSLPSANSSNLGKRYIIKSAMNAGVNLIVGTTGGQNIDSATTFTLARFESIEVISNGSGWDIVSDRTAAVYG